MQSLLPETNLIAGCLVGHCKRALHCLFFFFTSPFLFRFRDLQTRTTWQFINTSMRWHWNLAQPELTQSSLQVFATPEATCLDITRQLRLIPGNRCTGSHTPLLPLRALLWSAFNQEKGILKAPKFLLCPPFSVNTSLGSAVFEGRYVEVLS